MSRYLPCPECGASVARDTPLPHACDPRRRAEYLMFGMREQIAAFETAFRDHLGSPLGRFEAWMAAREVRRAQ